MRLRKTSLLSKRKKGIKGTGKQVKFSMSNSPKDVSSNVLSASGMSKKRRRRRNHKKSGGSDDKSVVKSDELQSLPKSDEADDLSTFTQGKKQIFNADNDELETEHMHNDVHSDGYANGGFSNVEEKLEPKETRDEINAMSSNNPPIKEHKKTKHKPSKDAYKKGPKVVKVFGTGSAEDDDDDVEGSYHSRSHMNKSDLLNRAEKLLQTRKSLPVYQHKDEILQYYNESQVIVVIGETGSGKSTQIPQFLMGANDRQIGVTQPRRVAAASLAQRVSEEYGCKLGDQVGYQVRFANVTSPSTKLKYLTDGMLLRELMLDKELKKYSCIVIDEAHERTVLTDMILGFLKQLLLTKKRPDLKIIVMSATLNAQLFSDFFQAPILYIEGRLYPVAKYYLNDSSEDIIDTMVRAVVQVNMSEPQGDILCFLPGQEEIDNAVSILQSLAPELPREAPLLVPVPLYAALSPNQQLKIFETFPPNKRKVVLATNIAETSITVSGVRYVIDSGLRKVKVWKHQLGLSTLLTTTISQASAKQRAGRAGREASGKVFRLYLEDVFYHSLPKEQESEIMRNDIVLPVLNLKKNGIDDILNWPWIEHPGEELVLSALSTLYSLGALDDNGKITKLGNKMAILPLPPQLSVVLLYALQVGVLKEVIDIVACLSVYNLILNVTGSDGEQRDEVNFKRRNYCPLGCQFGDLIAIKEYFRYYEELMDANNIDEAKAWCKELHFNYKGFRNVMKIRQQLKDYMFATIRQDNTLKPDEREKDLNSLKAQLQVDKTLMADEEITLTKRPLDVSSILKSFLKGYITNVAIGMPDRSFRTCLNGLLISIHPSSNLFGKSSLQAIMYIEYVFTAKGYARTCSAIELAWLQEIAPHILGGTKVSIKD